MSELVKGMQFGSHIIDERLEDGTYLTHCAECGRVHVLSRPALREAKARNGVCRSCAIARINQKCKVKHGATRKGGNNPKDYHILHNLIGRCHNPKNKDYHSYGARGIQVEAPWYVDGHANYSAFHEWYVAEEEKARQIYDEKYWDKFQVDRVNNDGNYSPYNCRLTTVKVQSNNRRNTRYIDGVPMRVWFDAHKTNDDVQYKVFYRRVVGSGWDLERAISTPVTTSPKILPLNV